MGYVTSTVNDLLVGSLINITAYSPGQIIDSTISATCMQVGNDLLESLSNDQAFVFTQNENIFAWTSGQYSYTVGNPVAANTFGAYTVSGSAVLTGITNAAAITVAFGINGSGVQTGGSLSDTLSSIAGGATIVSLTAGTNYAITFSGAPSGSSGTLSGWSHGAQPYVLISFSDGEIRTGAITLGGSISWTGALTGIPTTAATVNTTYLTMSANASQTLTEATGSTTVSYTIPGNFCIPRPLRMRTSFTRVTTSAAAGLDYFLDFQSFERYKEIGLKTVPGPWPYLAAYQPTYPYGTLWVYPNPSIPGQAYVFTDYIIQEFTSLTQQVNLPQGYNRAIKKLWGLELCPIFGKTPSPLLITQAKEAKMLLKNLNTDPVVTLRYDSDLVFSRHTDASFIVNGGFV